MQIVYGFIGHRLEAGKQFFPSPHEHIMMSRPNETADIQARTIELPNGAVVSIEGTADRGSVQAIAESRA